MKKKLLAVSSIPLYPEAVGGGEVTEHLLFEHLMRCGWQIECLCQRKQEPQSLISKVLEKLAQLNEKFFGHAFFKKDRRTGYTVWRGNLKSKGGKKFFHKLLKKIDPDIVFGHYYNREYDIDLLKDAADKGFKTFCYVQIIKPILQEDALLPENINFVANSAYTRLIIQKHSKKPNAVIEPVINRCDIYSEERKPQYILFVNPIPEKGVFLLLDIVKRLPNEEFLIINGGWSFVDYGENNEYVQELGKFSNVTIWEKVENLKEAFKYTKILLLPSQVLETFSRLIVEAHINSIPVVASPLGSIPTTLGKGGVLVKDPVSVDEYVDAIVKLCKDKEFYKKISSCARINSLRDEFNSNFIIKKFINIFGMESR